MTANPFKPSVGNTDHDVNKLHNKSDVDSSPNAQHHTLGWGVNQSAPGYGTNTRLKALENGGGGSSLPYGLTIARANPAEHNTNNGSRAVGGWDTIVALDNFATPTLPEGRIVIPATGWYSLYLALRFADHTINNYYMLSVREYPEDVSNIRGLQRSVSASTQVVNDFLSGVGKFEKDSEIVPYIFTGNTKGFVGSASLAYQRFTIAKIS